MSIRMKIRLLLQKTAFIAACVPAIAACGSAMPSTAGTGAADTTTGSGGNDTATGSPTDVKATTGSDTAVTPGGAVTDDELKVSISVLGDQALLKGKLIKPVACTATAPCPFLVVVGDYDSNAYPEFVPGAKQMASALKIVIAVFNLPGMGTGSNKSEGTDDVGGVWHQTAVKEVMHLKSAANYIDKNHMGYLSIGTGLMPVAKALKTYATTGTLSKVSFVIDVEGPVDRCSASQGAADPAAGIGPSDGPGASDSACHYSKDGNHAAMYPPASGGKPASIVCSAGAWPITKTGMGCNENSWWVEREPYTYLKDAFYRYQRLQFEHDHRLPSYWASRLAIQALVASKSKYFRLNDMEPCGSAWSDADCVGQPCWLQGAYGTGLPPAPFADGKLVKVTTESLFTQVLPGYVARMIDTGGNKDCH